ncbi:hypothetical protein WJX73_007791 [Symbiochloris irregularis]|uniref:EF-hand domain-containing protein 1 n=1 Tax=Symbiochloris irregularis TaxID=706552 RepID=A0AAW1NZJ0_9CHLO
MASVDQPPLLPGYTGYQVRGGQGDYSKKQTLRYQKGYATTDGDSLPVTGQSQGSTSPEMHVDGAKFEDTRPGVVSLHAFTAAARPPQWVECDRQVLRWFGYYKESIPNSPVENFRVRRVVIHYYLDNDTLDVVEPRERNSGLPQGVIIKRHKILKEDRKTPFTIADFVVGERVTLYGKTVQIVDADPYTRRHLDSKGVPVNPAQEYPDTPFAKTAALAQRHTESPTGKTLLTMAGQTAGSTLGKLETYLQNSGKVLRFFGVWDDREALYGDRRPYRLHYFLEDSTVEVLETNERNSGRQAFPVFLRRGPLPKVQDAASTKMGRTVDKALCYGPSDFRIGTVIPVFGRPLFVHDCDAFTREWYKANMGFTEEELAPIDVREPPKAVRVQPLPPPTGYGSPEDTEANCTSLVPRPPKRDFIKLMHKDKIVLRFRCRLVQVPGGKPLTKVDSERRMVMSYFAANDMMAIFEPPLPNTGVVGGKYLERCFVCKPKSTDRYTDQDLYVGAVLDVHGAYFELFEADEFTLQYMESNRSNYPQADISVALATIRDSLHRGKEAELRTALAEADTGASGCLTFDQLDAALSNASIPLIKHLVLALFRALQQPSDEGKTLAISDLLRLVGLRSN